MQKAPQQMDFNNSIESTRLKSVKEFNYHNVAMSIWNHLLKSSVVKAASPVIETNLDKAGTIKKPPKMKYTDLPIYQSPHNEYKDYIEDQKKCPEADVKLLQRKIYPIVRKYRKSLSESFYGMKEELSDIRKEIYADVCKRSTDFKKYMRDPENLTTRRAVVVAGIFTGLYIGSGTRSLSKKLFFSSLGALATGALCFPSETDVIFRNISYRFGNLVIAVYNATCKKNFSMRQRLPCPDELPPPPPSLAAHQINKKCYDKKIEKGAEKKDVVKDIPKHKPEVIEIIK